MKLQAIRNHFHLSKEEFGVKIGLSIYYISALERGSYPIQDSTVEKACKVFDIDPAYLNDDVNAEDLNRYIRVEKKTDGLQPGERLKLIREERKLSQKELCKLSGTSQSVISRIEKDDIPLTRKQAEKMAEALCVGADYLLYGDVDKKDAPVNQTMIDWLWEHKEERERIWEEINARTLLS